MPDDKQNFVLLEDLVASRLPDLFGGYKIVDHAAFRLTRDMDVNLLEQEADDLLRSIESRLRARQRTEAVRLEISAGMNPALLKMLVTEEELHYDTKPRAPGVPEAGYNEVYEVKGPLDMTCLHELVQMVDRKDLRDPPLVPRPPVNLYDYDDLFAEIADHDILLHHPYESFTPVLNFIELAARDPQVLAIKQTLYRTSGGDSPVVRALAEAAENGKHVTALVELKARFDEANNITWARHLERAGVHVVFGFMGLKTHCKLAMVVRKEGKKVRRYVHLSTGNYNPNTALVYTDLGLFTADKVLADDVSALFNLLTGYSQNHEWQKLVIAPSDLKRRTLELINEQTRRAREGKKARIIAKLNSLVDRQTIEALYEASQAGVPIDLLIRGICCLRPGLPGHFREHSRLQHRRSVPGTQPHSRVRRGRKGASIPKQRRLDAAQFRAPCRGHVPDRGRRSSPADRGRNHSHVHARQRAHAHAAIRRHVHSSHRPATTHPTGPRSNCSPKQPHAMACSPKSNPALAPDRQSHSPTSTATRSAKQPDARKRKARRRSNERYAARRTLNGVVA